MANALLIWDNNKSYAEELSLELGISYSDDAVFSFEELKQNKLVSVKDAIIVLLDTNLDGKKRTEYFGLEIVKYLRKELRYKGLIVVYSTLTEQQIRERVEKSEILFTSGIRLREFKKKEAVKADEIEELIQSVPKLSDDLLDDIRYNVFDTKGKIHELLHNLKNKLNDIKGKKTLKDFTKETNAVFEEYRKLLLKEIDPFKTAEFEKLYAALSKETVEDITNHWNNEKEKSSFSYANAGNQVNKFSNQIVELAPVSNDDANPQQAENINWQVLFFDDTEGVRTKVKTFFEEKNVTCHTAATEEEVYQKLKENSPNISLFISDIRLLDKNEHWSDRQGYDVIDQVNKTNDYPLVYAVLTSKKGTINKMVQKKRKYEILWFTKDDVINNIHSFNIFFDLVKGYADENFNSNNTFQPNTSAWLSGKEYKYRHPLKTYYRHHKQTNNSEFIIIENAINKKVIAFIESIIPEYRNSIGEEVFIQNWRCLLSEDLIDEYELRKFRDNKLLGRRLVLALGIFYELPSLKIFEIMTGEKDDSKKSGTRQLFGQLAISQKLVQLKEQIKSYSIGDKLPILKEEYNFLKEEFIDEELSSVEDLGEDYKHLRTIMNDIKKVFDKKNLQIPSTFMRVKYVLEDDKMPKLERLDRMLSEIVLLDKANNIINEIDVKSPFKQIKNTNLISMFLRHQFMSL